MVDKSDSEGEGDAALKYITPEKMRELELGAAEYGLGVGELMENAGKAVAGVVLDREGPGSNVGVLCGRGNNGGDGFVAARHLSSNCKVDVILLAKPEEIRTEEARRNWRALEKTSARRHVADTLSKLKKLANVVADADVMVVAIFGTGIKGSQIGEPYATAITMANQASGDKVAVDLPSGIDPSTGAASRPSFRADVTVALHMPKSGLKGRKEFTGEVLVAPIGIRGGSG